MLFNVVVSLLLLYVIVKLHLIKELLKLVLSICCIPFILLSKCFDWCKILVQQPTKSKVKNGKKPTVYDLDDEITELYANKGLYTTQEFYEEMQNILERYAKTGI